MTEAERGGMDREGDIEEVRGEGEDMALEAGQDGLEGLEEENSVPEAHANAPIAIDPSLEGIPALVGEVPPLTSASHPRPRPKMKTVTFEESVTSDTPAAPIDHPTQSAAPAVQAPTLPINHATHGNPAVHAAHPGPSNNPNKSSTSDSVQPREWWDPANRYPPMRSPPLLPAGGSASVPSEPAVTESMQPLASTSDQPAKRARGRPKGSKNKPKEDNADGSKKKLKVGKKA
ncbi:hypothetical protein FRC08_007731 [Ceratobasidium sp. 394]|nr:hypothetical protein FRC08_007731 [Ceratobasidium sp. 394]